MTRVDARTGVEYYIVGSRGTLRNPELPTVLTRIGVREGSVASRDLRQAPSDVLRPHIDSVGAHDAIGRDLTGGEVGCALSHRDHWDLAWHRGCEWALVIEDDAVPQGNLREALGLAQQLPGSVPIVVALHDSPQGAESTPVVSSPVLRGADVAFYLCLHNTGGTVAYLVNRAALSVLRSGPTKLICPSDWPAVAGRLAFLAALPAPVTTPGAERHSVIGRRNSASVAGTPTSTKAWFTYVGRYWRLRRNFPGYPDYFRWSYGSGRGFLKHSKRLGIVRDVTISVGDRDLPQTVLFAPLWLVPGVQQQYQALTEDGNGNGNEK